MTDASHVRPPSESVAVGPSATGANPLVVTQPEPCQCHRSFAYISPMHLGHCCFFPATQTCHAEEVVAWERAYSLRTGRRMSANDGSHAHG